MTCKWIVRDGNGFPYWAYTSCEKGFNPLSRISKVKDIKPYYDGRQCPICKKPIECNIELVDLDWIVQKPIAWMPLPEPYKESEESNG